MYLKIKCILKLVASIVQKNQKENPKIYQHTHLHNEIKYGTIEPLNEDVPETADGPDGGSLFAPSSGAHKHPRIEVLHGPIKKAYSPRKKICMGNGRLRGRSRECLITGLHPLAEIAEPRSVDVIPI